MGVALVCYRTLDDCAIVAYNHWCCWLCSNWMTVMSTVFQGKEEYLSVVKKYVDVHGTVFMDNSQSESILPGFVTNHGILSGPELHKLLLESKVCLTFSKFFLSFSHYFSLAKPSKVVLTFLEAKVCLIWCVSVICSVCFSLLPMPLFLNPLFQTLIKHLLCANFIGVRLWIRRHVHVFAETSHSTIQSNNSVHLIWPPSKAYHMTASQSFIHVPVIEIS